MACLFVQPPRKPRWESAGAPDNEIEITPEMIMRGRVFMHAKAMHMHDEELIDSDFIKSFFEYSINVRASKLELYLFSRSEAYL